MYCPKCENLIEDVVSICPVCGAVITDREWKMSKKGFKSKLFWILRIVSICMLVPATVINIANKITVHSLVIYVLGVILYALSQYVKHRDKIAKPITDNEFLVKEKLSLNNNETVRLVSKKVITKSVVLTLVFGAALYLILDLLYYKLWVLPVVAIAVLLYVRFMLENNTFSYICKKISGKTPDITVDDIILEDCYNEFDTPRIVSTLITCVVIIAAAVSGFVYFNREGKGLVYEDVNGGVSVYEYEPGLLHLRDAVEIPETSGDKTVVQLSDYAFAWNVFLKSVNIPDTVTYIGESAFDGCCYLEKVRMSKNVTELSKNAFTTCCSLVEIDLPDTLTKLGENVFTDCKSLKSIKIPDGVTVIPKETFYGCTSLETVEFNNITEFGEGAFADCDSIVEATFSEGITTISDNLFDDCDNLETVIIPKGVTTIGKYAFANCADLSYVSVPDTVTKIEEYAFENCDELERIALPKDISIGDDAFDEETEITQKKFTDEISEKIDNEFSEFTIEKIYVVYNKNQGENIIFSPRDDGSITVATSPRFTDNLADYMALYEFDSPVEFREYLKRAKTAGMDNVLLAFDSKIAEEQEGEPYFVSYNFDIGYLIEVYEQNPDKF